MTIRPTEYPHQKLIMDVPTLYVEGKRGGIDEQVMRNACEGISLDVHALGGSSNLRNLAVPFSNLYKNVYFLIDRDHRIDSEVENIISEFQGGGNLLIWEKRELENYFLDVEFLSKSKYLSNAECLKKTMLEEAQKRIYRDAAESAFLELLYEFNIRKYFKKKFTIGKFNTKESAERELKSTNLKKYEHHLGKCFTMERLLQKFERKLNLISGGYKKLNYHNNNWANIMNGSDLLEKISKSSAFSFKDAESDLTGKKDKHVIIVLEIMNKDRHNHHEKGNIPDGIWNIRELIRKRAT